MDSLTYFDTVPVKVTDHAMWRAAERHPGFRTEHIEQEVRAALQAGHVSHDRRVAGCSAGWGSLEDWFAWVPGTLRVYCLRMTDREVLVTTTLRRTTDHA